MEKKSSKTKKVLIGIVLFVLLALIGLITFSPYGKHETFTFKEVGHTIDINAPTEKVFKFLGNSANASRWSVYVNHIITLNADAVPDGAVGSRRRCFCNPDRTGRQWDELITVVEKNKKRQLTIYNLKDFNLKVDNLATEQLYEPIDANKCRLTFIVFFKDVKPSLTDQVKMYFGAYDIKSVFKANMDNIKHIVEEEYAKGI